MKTFRQQVVYQIYPRAFCDSNGDGTGDLPGIISKLDYLQSLGVSYLWLTPFFLSPQRDNGYDVADYCSVDPVYGTMEDVETLIREAGSRGMGLMLDMVFNHTSTAHAWFQRALQGDPQYMDYYNTDGPWVHEYLREMVEDTGIGDMITVGEMSSTTLDHCIRYSAPENRELAMVFNFHHLKIDYLNGNKWQSKPPDIGQLREIFRSWQEGMANGGGWSAVFWCNHDQPRIVSRLGSDGPLWREGAKCWPLVFTSCGARPISIKGKNWA